MRQKWMDQGNFCMFSIIIIWQIWRYPFLNPHPLLSQLWLVSLWPFLAIPRNPTPLPPSNGTKIMRLLACVEEISASQPQRKVISSSRMCSLMTWLGTCVWPQTCLPFHLIAARPSLFSASLVGHSICQATFQHCFLILNCISIASWIWFVSTHSQCHIGWASCGWDCHSGIFADLILRSFGWPPSWSHMVLGWHPTPLWKKSVCCVCTKFVLFLWIWWCHQCLWPFFYFLFLSDRGQNLVIESVNKLDEGSYYCKAVNEHGSTHSASVYVAVIGRWN